MNKSAKPDHHLQNQDGAISEKDEIRTFFDDMSVGRNEAIEANPVVCYEQELRAQTVLRMLDVKPGERILDIGCGNARDIARIAEAGGKVFGVDVSPGMVAAAQQELTRMGIGDVELQVGDATCLDFPNACFDKVLCSEVIEHIPNASQALSEMYRVLKPGGKLVLSTPNKGSWYGFERYWIWQGLLRRKWPHPCDEWRSLAEVLDLVTQHRFVVTEQKSVCFVPGFIVTYFVLPRQIQRFLIRLVVACEPSLQRWFQTRGYTICVMAMRDGK